MIPTIQQALLIIFFAWHYALKCGFISDDHAAVEARKDIIPDAERDPFKETYWVKVFNDGVLMYYWNALMSKLYARNNALVWHSLCLGLHLLNCWLWFLVLTPLIGQENAVIAVVFWGINPMLDQNTVWISGRPYVIATTLALVCFLQWENPFIVLPLYGLAVITNISIVFLPFLIKILQPQGWQPNLYIAFAALAGFPFILWKFYRRFTKSLIIDRDNFRFKKRRFNVLARIYAYYLWTIFVPVRMGWYHQAGFKYNQKWERFNIWAMLGYALVFYLATQGFAGALFLLGILPNANLFATNSFVQDRYIYFGSMGIAVLLAPWLLQYPILFWCAVTFYATRSYMYSRHMINDEEMYKENWRNHPKSDYAVNNYSYFLIRKKAFDEARVVIQKGLEIDPTNKMLWYNLGVTWAGQGHFQTEEGKFKFLRAVDCWKKCLELEPRWQKPAEDLKKLIGILVERKVLTLSPDQTGEQPVLNVPNIKGLAKVEINKEERKD